MVEAKLGTDSAVTGANGEIETASGTAPPPLGGIDAEGLFDIVEEHFQGDGPLVEHIDEETIDDGGEMRASPDPSSAVPDKLDLTATDGDDRASEQQAGSRRGDSAPRFATVLLGVALDPATWTSPGFVDTGVKDSASGSVCRTCVVSLELLRALVPERRV